MRECAVLLGLLLSLNFLPLAQAGEMLLKPVGGAGAGERVDGLQATVQPVKAEFGPGESVMLHWTISNAAPEGRQLLFDRNNRRLAYFEFEATRNGEPVKLGRRKEPGALHGEVVQKTLAPGGQLDFWFDLMTPDWEDKNWLAALGQYSVVVRYTGAPGGKPLAGGRVAFTVAAAGTPVPGPRDPAEAERVKGWIAQLGADDFEQREAAQKSLIEYGEAALELLREATAGAADAEVRLRCKRILERIEAIVRQRGRAQPLCAGCLGKGFTADVGRCAQCQGFTPSGAWRFCQACAVKLVRCAACGRELGAAPPPPPQPLPGPPPRPRPLPRPPIPKPPLPVDPGPPDDF